MKQKIDKCFPTDLLLTYQKLGKSEQKIKTAQNSTYCKAVMLLPLQLFSEVSFFPHLVVVNSHCISKGWFQKISILPPLQNFQFPLRGGGQRGGVKCPGNSGEEGGCQ